MSKYKYTLKCMQANHRNDLAGPMVISSLLTSQSEAMQFNPGSTIDLKEEVSRLRYYIAEIHKVLIDQEQEKVKDKLDLSQTKV